MRKITLLFALFLVTSFLSVNSQVTIGTGSDGSSTNSPPISPYYGYSYSQSIYLASEINASGSITSIDLALNPGTDISSADDMVDVWIGHTSKTMFDSSSDWVDVSGLTQVLTNGTITSANDVLTITFSAPFAYNGTDNLIIAVDANEDGFGSFSDYILSTNGPTAAMTLDYRSDGTNSDPSSPETGTLRQNRGNITFNGITQSCPNPTGLTSNNVTSSSADMSWSQGGTETDWEYALLPSSDPAPSSGTVTTMMSYNATSLTDNTDYTFYVRADCGGDTSGWISTSFTTLPLPPANDDCAGAIDLDSFMNTDDSCTLSYTGTNAGATNSAGEVAPSGSCSDSDATPSDIWFSLTVPSTGGFIYDDIVVPGFSSIVEVYTGSCGGLTPLNPVNCSNSSNEKIFEGLTPGNTVYLRYWDYGSDEEGSLEFCIKQLPPPIVPDYSNDFATYPGTGWTEASGAYGSPTGTSSSWVGDDYGNDTGSANGQSARVEIWSTSTDEYLISPTFDLSGGTYYLNFDVALTVWNSTASATLGADDYVALLVTQDDTNWSELRRWDSSSTIGTSREPTPEIELSGYNATTKFAFYAFSDTSNEDNNFYVDNFQITNFGLSIEDNVIEGFTMYPNPVNDKLYFNALDNINDISIFNLLGQEVMNSKPNVISADVDMSDLPTGMYVVKVKVGEQLGSYRIVKE